MAISGANLDSGVHVACPVCETRDFDHRFDKLGYAVVQCARCRFVMVNPRPPENQLAQIYSESYFKDMAAMGKTVIDEATCRNRAATLAGFIQRATGLAQGSRVLDVGCAYGHLMEALSSCGYLCDGVEVSPDGAAVCQGKGLSVVEGCFESVELSMALYDAVTAIDVVEHVFDLERFMGRVSTLLRSGGFFIFEIPDVGGYGAWRHGPDWQHYHPPYHLNFFTHRTVKLFLKRHGFIPVVCYSQPSFSLGIRKGLRQLDKQCPWPVWLSASRALQHGIGGLKRRYFYPLINWIYQVTGLPANNMVVVAQAP